MLPLIIVSTKKSEFSVNPKVTGHQLIFDFRVFCCAALDDAIDSQWTNDNQRQLCLMDQNALGVGPIGFVPRMHVCLVLCRHAPIALASFPHLPHLAL
jgi:hypothetical protein